MQDAVPPFLRYFLAALFFASGFSGLIYESLWAQYFKLFLGHAAYAQTTVLVLYLGGMGIGAWLAGRCSDRIKNPILWYGLIEGVIGLIAISFHSVFTHSINLYFDFLLPFAGSAEFANIAKISLSAFLLLPLAILLGATFPLMSCGFIRLFPQTPGRDVALLYFTNSIGAAIGILVSGFFFISQAGLPGTLSIAGNINLLVALLAIILSLIHEQPHARLVSLIPKQPATIEQSWILPLLLIAGLTGFASFLYEIGWIRMLSLVLGSTTHAFELMLASFIFGIAIGGFVIRQRLDRLKNPLLTLAAIQLLMGLFAILTITTYGWSFEIMKFGMQALSRTEEGYWLFNLNSQLICMLVMLPAAICAGMTLPLISLLLVRTHFHEQAIGFVVSINTLGCILGVLAGIHLIMPLFGLKMVIVIGALIDIGLGLYILFRLNEFRRFTVRMAAATGTLICLVLIQVTELDTVKMASGVFRHGKLIDGKTILFHKDGKTASIDVFDSPEGNRSIATNGKPDASLRFDQILTGDDVTTEMLAALPLSIHPKARDIAVIGLGSGRTTHTLLTHPEIHQVDTIEIEPAMIEGARLFGELVHNTFEDPRSHLVVEDAKSWFSRSKQKYDIIISEPSNPWVSGVSSLFTHEFYQHIQHNLTPGGVFAQWIQLYEIDKRLLASIVKALAMEFEYFEVYTANEVDLLVIASNQPIPKPGHDIFQYPELARILARSGIRHEDDFLVRHIGSKALLEPYFNAIQIAANSDYYPVLDLETGKTRFLGSRVTDLKRLRVAGYPMEIAPEARENINKPVTPSTLYEPTSIANQAWKISQATRQLADADKGKSPNANMTETSKVIRELAVLFDESTLCRDPAQQTLWLAALNDTMRTALPWIDHEQLAPVFSRIKSSSCWHSLETFPRDWVILYEALNEKDYVTTLRLATKLMVTPKIKEDDADYLVGAAMTAAMKLGKDQTALMIYQQYRTQTHRQKLEHDVLASHAYKRLKNL